jgi:Domain of unknown function (DUF4034)
MIYTLPHRNLKIVAAIAIVSLAVSASSCGQTRASSPAVPMETVMKAVRDYGRGHQSAISPGPPSVPAETDEQYAARINNLFLGENFAELEKMEQQNRIEKGRVRGGIWKSSSFFSAVALPRGEELKDSDYDFRISTAKKWVAAYPDSAAARIALANVYSAYAGFARGSGFADSVSDAHWKLYHSRVAQAKQVLLEAAALKDKDAHWFDVMMQVSNAEGWDPAQERELFDQAVAFEPSYYHFYRRYANYLLPQWYGQPGDVESFADEIAAHRQEPESSIFYFEIVGTLTCYCQKGMEALSQTSWPRTKQGYANMQRLYGTSNLKANRFAFLAFVAKDQSAAHDAFASITAPELDIWNSEDVFYGVRAWADAGGQ